VDGGQLVEWHIETVSRDERLQYGAHDVHLSLLEPLEFLPDNRIVEVRIVLHGELAVESDRMARVENVNEAMGVDSDGSVVWNTTRTTTARR